MSTAVGARILCPEWCTLTAAEHREQIDGDHFGDGKIEHYGEVRYRSERSVVLQWICALDGYDDSKPGITFLGDTDDMTSAQAVHLARMLLDAVDELNIDDPDDQGWRDARR